ncbi:hypothetical protein OV208_28765 [Corallococcus sp. bb12-1]|uniref:hypothetical protein n=1 Tax=Corallococcus sp. bb12-1 TaxID=2996784 RepID=UPI00226FDB09|nr:hypothetical protein [Corallococcus sp. bb12-1]MCY1045343.1 hypothetical protein [Corallococcus sp. bb12-1]
MRQSRRSTFLGWVVATCLLTLHAVAAPAADQIKVERRNEVLALSWQDAEDTLQGVITPAEPRPGEPLRLTLSVGNIQGPPFEGGVTVAFSQDGVPGQVTRALKRDAVGWSTEFVPPEPGAWDLDVRFLTSRPKALHAKFTVSEPGVPLLVWRTLLGLVGMLVLVGVLRALTQREVPAESPGEAPEQGPTVPPASVPEVEPPPTPPVDQRADR